MEQTKERWWQTGFEVSPWGEIQLIDEKARTSSRNTYLKVSPSAMESLLSEPVEAQLSQEEKMGKLLRLTYGILAHDFFTLSGAAVLWKKDSERSLQEHLTKVFRNWRTNDLHRAERLLSQLKFLGQETLNQHDYLSLLKSTLEEAEQRGPFTDTLPLKTLKGMVSPRDFDAEWERIGMEAKLERFAFACQKFHQQSVLFQPWNKDYLLMEAGFLLVINCRGLRFVVPLRMDLIHYPNPTDELGRPDIYDLKTSIKLPNYPQKGAKRISISPLLYRIAANQLPLKIWEETETKKELSEIWFRESELRLTSELPSFTILGYQEKRGEIKPSTLKSPESWENKLLAQLGKVQKILEEKEMVLAPDNTPRLNSQP